MATGDSDLSKEHTSHDELSQLHQQLRQLQAENAGEHEAIATLQTQIHTFIPKPPVNSASPHLKDPSSDCSTMHINFSGGKGEDADETETGYLEFFAQTASNLGLQLDILTESKWESTAQECLAAKEFGVLASTLITSDSSISKWAEDSVEYLVNGEIATLPPFNAELLIWAMTEGRRQRWQGLISDEHLNEALQDDGAWVPLGVRVNTFGMGQIRAEVEQKRGKTVGQLRAYIEGGNAITTKNAEGQTLLLVGRDAIDATALMYQLTIDEVRQLIQEDFGLDYVEQVLAIEQPGQFHLDMGILSLGNGVVVVNDSEAAYKDGLEMVEMVRCMTTEVMAAKSTLQYKLEEQAARELAAAGLTVKRECLSEGVAYNFLNGEFVVGETGDRCFITNGGPEEQQQRFKILMLDSWKVVEKVVFTPIDIAQNSLQEKGGVGCRAKGSSF